MILVGDRAVGKSNLASKYTINKFDLETPATQGVGFREKYVYALHSHHNEDSGDSPSESPAYRLFTYLFVQAQIKENIRPHVTGLCEGNSPVTCEFLA